MFYYWIEYSFDERFYNKAPHTNFFNSSPIITDKLKSTLIDLVENNVPGKPDHLRIVREYGVHRREYFHFSRENIWSINLLDTSWFKPETAVRQRLAKIK